MGCAVKNDSETESGFSHFCGGEKHSDCNIHPKNHTTVSECVYVRHTPHELKGELALCIVRTGFTSELKCIFRIFCLNKGQNHGAGGIRKTYLLLPLLQPLTSVLIPPSNCLNFTFSLQKLGFKPIAIQDSWYLHLLFKHMCRTDRQLQHHGEKLL